MIQHGTLGPADSPYELRDDWPNAGGPQYDPYKSTAGKTASSTVINPAERTALILTIGQSLISNENDAGGSLHTPTNATKVDNLDPYTGAMWRGKDPWLGCAGQNSSWLGKFADAAINSGMFARVIIEPIGIGGRPPRDWNRIGWYHHRAMVGLKRLRDLIGAGTPPDNAFPMVFWMMQGATAENPVDGHVTTYANYVTDFNETHSLMAGLGIGTWPWYVSRTTYIAGVTKTDIRAAQVDVCNGTTIRQGPDTDTVTARVDGVHFTAAGCTQIANLWHAAVDPYY